MHLCRQASRKFLSVADAATLARQKSVKWQRGMKGLGEECGEKSKRVSKGRGWCGDCRRKDGRALRKGSLGGEGEKGVREGGEG